MRRYTLQIEVPFVKVMTFMHCAFIQTNFSGLSFSKCIHTNDVYRMMTISCEKKKKNLSNDNSLELLQRRKAFILQCHFTLTLFSHCWTGYLFLASGNSPGNSVAREVKERTKVQRNGKVNDEKPKRATILA